MTTTILSTTVTHEKKKSHVTMKICNVHDVSGEDEGVNMTLKRGVGGRKSQGRGVELVSVADEDAL